MKTKLMDKITDDFLSVMGYEDTKNPMAWIRKPLVIRETELKLMAFDWLAENEDYFDHYRKEEILNHYDRTGGTENIPSLLESIMRAAIEKGK